MSSLSGKKVFLFGNGKADGDKSMKELLGGKGANLSEMSSIGMPVPSGFTVSTECCAYFSENEGAWPESLGDEVGGGIAHIEEALGAKFGDAENPLLVSVRSGAAQSMPGMMDTVLNLGMSDKVAEGLAKKSGERFAYDAYRRFIDMYGCVVMGVEHDDFEHALHGLKTEKGAEEDTDLSADDLKELVELYKGIYEKHVGEPFPEDPRVQLDKSIDAVFGSWDSDRAIKYRTINKIRGLIGTAVNVQAMVYGNMGDDSGTGVCFTRNPSTGANELYGEFLVNAQGEDVVAGIRTPLPMEEMADVFPQAYTQLVETMANLEDHYKNMQDIEFTVQNQNLFILQTRNGKRTGKAAVQIAVDLVNSGKVDKKTAVADLVEPGHIDQLLHPRFEDEEAYRSGGMVVAKGLPASPGAAVGKIVFSASDAEEAKAQGEKVMLVRIETSPEDVGGMDAAEGILTSRGGMTSHAAVVARGWGKPCVAGCGDVRIDYASQSFSVGGDTFNAGEWISINGTSGEVIKGQQPTIDAKMDAEFATFMSWADEFRKMGVRTNADAPADAAKAVEFGAEGIGLCRTEHMFFEGDRITHVREMILAENEADRREALAKLLPEQRKDFYGIFKAMDGKPVTIRLLDPPLHEFLPHTSEDIDGMAASMGVPASKVHDMVASLEESNPMLGHRGCRLGTTYPEITEMQARAIIEAAVDASNEGVTVLPEIMVPLIGTLAEFSGQRDVIKATADTVFAEKGKSVDYLIGTMIEIPRACLMADKIAAEAEFFSFGTNDLTQMTFGYSRDDAGKFLPHYVENKILQDDPFQQLDQDGVGQLVEMGTKRGRSTNPDLKVGICGEHGGDPSSVEFCYNVGMNYVSCSPFRVQSRVGGSTSSSKKLIHLGLEVPRCSCFESSRDSVEIESLFIFSAF